MERVSEKDLAYRDGNSGVKYLFRGPKIDWGVILLLPGQTLSPHYHEQVEETFYILEGQADFTVDGATQTLQAGEAVRLEPTEKHAVVNSGSEPVKMVFIKSPYLPKDKVDL